MISLLQSSEIGVSKVHGNAEIYYIPNDFIIRVLKYEPNDPDVV